MASSVVVAIVTTSTLGLTLPVVARALFPRRTAGRRRALLVATVAVVAVAVAVELYGRRLAPFGGGPLRGLVAVERVGVLLFFGAMLVTIAAEVVGRLAQAPLLALAWSRHTTAAKLAPAFESRRELLTQAAAASALAVGAPAFLRGGLNRTDFQQHDVEVHVADLPPELEGLTLVQITDLHLGIFTGEREIGEVIDRVQRLRGDLVVITGDILDHNPRHVPAAMRALARLQARGGVHAILGNHDHYTGPGVVARGLRSIGVRTLINQSVTLGPDGARGRGLVLAGVDDIMAPRLRTGVGPDLGAALRGRDPRDPVVLLAHNPMVFDEARGRVAVQLSGHTHGGQINTFGVSEALLPYVAGLYREGSSTLFVSRGIGTTGPPVRLSAPPEIVRLALTRRPTARS